MIIILDETSLDDKSSEQVWEIIEYLYSPKVSSLHILINGKANIVALQWRNPAAALSTKWSKLMFWVMRKINLVHL